MKNSANRLQVKHSRAWTAYQAGMLGEASQMYAALCRKYPRDDHAWMMLGVIHGQNGDYVHAEECLRRAVRLNPGNPDAILNHGLALFNLGELVQAIDVYRKLLNRVPGHAQTLMLLGNACAKNDQLVEAEAAYLGVLQSSPDNAAVFGNLANVLAYQGRTAEALEYYQRTLQLNPHQPGMHSNLLLCLHYDELQTPAEVYDRHRTWAENYAGTARRYSDFTNDPDPDRRLRIGLVTPDLRTHSVSYFIEPLLRQHDQEKLELFCYADAHFQDDTTARLAAHFAVLCNTVGLTDAELASTIHRDKIDILIDLAGHTENNRLLVFARRPAPVQITWLGYPDTTGLDEIDYRITDAKADPPGSSELYCSEELVRLENGFLCFAPPLEAASVSSPPVNANGYITFGSFNALTKITSGMLDAWAAILRQVPDSRLLIKNRQLTDVELRNRLIEYFRHLGVETSRLTLRGRTGKQEHMSSYQAVDLVLDSYPYNGTTTTCDALWMGVPVVTQSGDTHVSRVGASLLSRVGLDDLVCNSVDEYISCAISLAHDGDRLLRLHTTLREIMQASPLCNASAFTSAFQVLLERVWERWCMTQQGR